VLSSFFHFFWGRLSSWVKIRLHTENQLPTLSGSALKVEVWWWSGWVGGWSGWVVLLSTLSLSTWFEVELRLWQKSQDCDIAAITIWIIVIFLCITFYRRYLILNILYYACYFIYANPGFYGFIFQTFSIFIFKTFSKTQYKYK
jgi:hypothetical protein